MYMPKGTGENKQAGGKDNEQDAGRQLQDAHGPRAERLQGEAGLKAARPDRPQRKVDQSRQRLDPLRRAEPDGQPERLLEMERLES